MPEAECVETCGESFGGIQPLKEKKKWENSFFFCKEEKPVSCSLNVTELCDEPKWPLLDFQFSLLI